MALDLSALNAPAAPAALAAVIEDDGKPRKAPEILLSDIDPDPEQPRKQFDQAKLDEMTASIAARGVKSPVSVKPNPAKPGKWLLNYGEYRYRASQLAGKTTIPAFVDEAHDDYDQVIENTQRSPLRPMELAMFIKKKLAEGDKKGAIAKRLGVENPVITWHAALIEAPTCIEDLYSTGRCTTTQYLYELVKLHEKHPEAVEAWCETAEEVTRKTIAALSDELKGKKAGIAGAAGDAEGGQGKGRDPSAGQNSRAGAGADTDKGGSMDRKAGQGKGGADKAAGGKDDDQSGEGNGSGVQVQRIPPHNLDLENDPDTAVDSDKLKKPLMLVEFDGRAAMVVFRMPSAAGLLRIRYEDGSGDDEVDAGKVKINHLTRESA